MKRLLLIMVFPLALFGQGVYVPAKTVLGTINGITRPIAGAFITVCAPSTGGIPCSPALAGTVFQDSGLTVPLSNPLQADSNGNYPQFAMAPGAYTVTESASGFAGYSYQLSIACTTSAACVISTLTATSANISGTVAAGSITTSGNATIGTLGVTGNATVGGTLGVTSINGQQVVGQGTNTTIAAAMTAAGSTGSVLIPASFPCTELMNNTLGISVTDLRTCSDPNTEKVFSLITSSYPQVNAPLGHDGGIRGRGPSDIYLERLKAYTTTTATISPGLNSNVLIGTVSVGDSNRGVVQTGGASLFMNVSANTGLIMIGYGTAQQEQVTATLVDATHLSFTAANSHSGTTDIEEVGTLFIKQRNIIYDPVASKSAQQTTAQLEVLDSQANVLYWIPGNSGDTWPLGGWAFGSTITGAANAGGGHPTPGDLKFRNSSTSQVHRFQSFAGSDILTVADTAANVVTSLAIGKTTTPNAKLDIQDAAFGAATDFPFIIGDNASPRVEIGYSTTSIAGSKLVPAIIQDGTTTLEIGARGNQPSTICLDTSPDAGTTGLVCNLQINANGTTQLTKSIAAYNGTATAGNGLATIYGATSQKSETATADTNVLTFTPPATVGTYRVCFTASVSSATAGVIGWTLSWTDSNGNAQSNIAQSLFQLGAAAPALTFTTSAAGNYSSCTPIDVNNAAASIIVKWVGGGTTAAKVSATVERLI